MRASSSAPATEGIPFLGFRTYPNQRSLLPASVKRARRRLEALAGQFADGEIDRDAINRSLRAWIAHAIHGRLRMASPEDSV